MCLLHKIFCSLGKQNFGIDLIVANVILYMRVDVKHMVLLCTLKEEWLRSICIVPEAEIRTEQKQSYRPGRPVELRVN